MIRAHCVREFSTHGGRESGDGIGSFCFWFCRFICGCYYSIGAVKFFLVVVSFCIRDLLRYLPPLCQAPFLLLALRLACREQLHPLLLPVDPNQLQQKVEQQYSQELQQHRQGEQLPSPEEDCRLLLALCCFLYPKPDSVQRAKARDELTTQDAEEDKQRQQEQQQQQHTGITERQRLRFLHPTVDVR